MFAAWEIGVWKALRHSFQPDLVIGASAGAWNGWAIASGCSADDIASEWLDPLTAKLMQPGLHFTGILRPDALYAKARELFDRFRPQIPFALTVVEVPRMRLRLIRDGEIGWEHLAATCAIPFAFPPVRIDGKSYVDGGFLGALPLWAAEEMRARRAVAVNCLTTLPFRMLRSAMRPREPSGALEVARIEPSEPLGSVLDTFWWSADNIRRWIDQGERDGYRALSSFTM
jgi:NTE family protein